MPYRSDLEAAKVRIQLLERELEKQTLTNRMLREEALITNRPFIADLIAWALKDLIRKALSKSLLICFEAFSTIVIVALSTLAYFALLQVLGFTK